MFLRLLRLFWCKRTLYMLGKWKRSTSFGDCVVDRWERAQLLGFGKNTNIYDNSLVLGDVRVGSDTWIGPYTILDGSGGTLTIGDHCSISAGVQIYTHDTMRRTISAGKLNIDVSPTTIGNRCYIGPNVLITMGVTIGDGVVIGAYSFVNKDIASGSKAFGIPCKAICNSGC